LKHLPLLVAALAFTLAPVRAEAANKVLLIGDSWAALAGLVWNDTFADNGMDDVDVVVSAFNGGLATDYAGNPGLIPGLLDANPDVEWLLISLGGNDMLTAWTNEEESGWEERLSNAYRQILNPIVAAHPGVRIALLSYDFPNFELSPVCITLGLDTFRGLLTPQINLEIFKITTIQSEVAAEYGAVSFISAWGTLQANGGVPNAPNLLLPSPASQMTDCIHANDPGYRAFNQAVYDAYFPGQFACTTDADADGFTSTACGGVDCDDGNPAINPGIGEIAENGIDDDCNLNTPDVPPPPGGCTTTGAAGGAVSWLLSSLLLLPALLNRRWHRS